MPEKRVEDHVSRKALNDYQQAQLFLEQCAQYGFPLPNLVDGDEEAVANAETLLEFVRGLCQGLARHDIRESWPQRPYQPNDREGLQPIESQEPPAGRKRE